MCSCWLLLLLVFISFYRFSPRRAQNPNAEFNIYADPLGAQYAFANLTAVGVPSASFVPGFLLSHSPNLPLLVRLVSLDGTNYVPFPEFVQSTLAAAPLTPEGQFVVRCVGCASRKKGTARASSPVSG